MTTGGGRMYRSKCAVEAIWPLEETRKLQGTWRCRKGLVTYRAIGRAVWTMTRTTGSSSSSLNREIDAASEMVHDAPECVAVGVYVRGESTPEPPNCSRSFRARLACASRVRVSRASRVRLACLCASRACLVRFSLFKCGMPHVSGMPQLPGHSNPAAQQAKGVYKALAG